MRLVDLDPRWVGSGGEGIRNADGSTVPRREGIAVSFRCPCGNGERVMIPFTNPLDGKPSDYPNDEAWDRMGDTFETLTLRPSLQRADPGGCNWHGYLTDGVFRSC